MRASILASSASMADDPCRPSDGGTSPPLACPGSPLAPVASSESRGGRSVASESAEAEADAEGAWEERGWAEGGGEAEGEDVDCALEGDGEMDGSGLSE